MLDPSVAVTTGFLEDLIMLEGFHDADSDSALLL